MEPLMHTARALVSAKAIKLFRINRLGSYLFGTRVALVGLLLFQTACRRLPGTLKFRG
jgi:hypothetical protein